MSRPAVPPPEPGADPAYDYLCNKRERFRALMDGRITVEQYVASVKREVHEMLKRGGGVVTGGQIADPAITAVEQAVGTDYAYGVLRENVETMREAIIFALDEGRIGDHLGHWDRTGGHGSGCPACIANREAKRRLREALPPRGAAS